MVLTDEKLFVQQSFVVCVFPLLHFFFGETSCFITYNQQYDCFKMLEMFRFQLANDSMDLPISWRYIQSGLGHD